jgi:tetratricopeptide (TPR) repeat protein
MPVFQKSLTGARQAFLICLGLALATLAVYWRVHGFEFLAYDDYSIFFENPMVRQGLAWKAIVWGATTCYYEYWHPLMWWSHLLDCQLFGLNAGPHHLENLAFHVANTLLVFAVFRRMTGMVWRSAMVAALFGLHPLHVESVAWLAERKDLLSTLFWLLSVWAYAGYVERSKVHPPSPEPPRRTTGPKSKVAYGWSLFFFLLGLLTKPMVVTLPFVLLLLDYWPMRRISDLKTKGKNDTGMRLVWEKWPFFGLSALFCFITWYSTKLGNHIQPSELTPWASRLANIPVAYVRYLGKTAYPSRLAVLYPMPHQWPLWEVGGSILILLVITWQAMKRARSAPYLIVGWLLFLGTLVPTIGVVSVGSQAIADRYMYIPSLGLFAAAVWWVADFSSGWKGRKIILAGMSAVLLSAFGALTWVQVGYWHDTVSLWEHCLDTGAESLVAHYGLSDAYQDRWDMAGAVEQSTKAVQLAPEDADANQRLGVALTAAGKLQEATNSFAKALKLAPNYAVAHQNLGFALVDSGDLAGAAAQFAEAVQLQPTRLDAYAGTGEVLSAQGRSDDAISYYLATLRLEPAFARAYYLLGTEYLKRGDIGGAISNFEQNVEYNPGRVAPHVQLAQIFSQQHEAARAVSEYRAILRLNPDLPEALNNLAWILATSPDAQIRNGAEAVKLAGRACEQTSWQQTHLIGTLAAAYAEAGDFGKAVQTAQKACDLASAHGEKDLWQANQSLLALYKSGQPFRDKN